ncbi:serine hydrolase [Paenibacillus tarimensis]
MNNHFDSLFDKYYEEHHFAGVAFIKGSETIHFERAYGFAHRGFKVLKTTSTMFETASVTKLFTAVVILQLVDRGKLMIELRI